MGWLNAIEGMAQQGMQGQGGTNAKVAGGLLQALEEHPGGLGGVMSSLQQNGLGEQAQNWATGEEQTATPQQVQQGLNGTGLIERVAERAGVSPQVAQVALATLLPIVLAHFTQGGQSAPPQSGFGGMLGQILAKVI